MRAKYRFADLNTILFVTGVPLCGKSTVAMQVAAAIEGYSLQPMDIIRLVAQQVEELKPQDTRNPYVFYGSCDSFEITGNGLLTRENLVSGFNAYSEAVFSILKVKVLSGLETQGVRNLIFEGVQITPKLAEPYIGNRNKLIILTASKDRLERNREKLFGNDPGMTKRYSTDKLLMLQDELIDLSKMLSPGSYFVVDNETDYGTTSRTIVETLEKAGVIILCK